MNAIRWAALCARSESNRPHEWLYILNVIRNRVAHPGLPDIVRDVVLQPWQFSYFNKWTVDRELTDEELFDRAMSGYAGADHEAATAAAEDVFNRPRHQLPLGPKALLFWSPVSMDPAYSIPKWNWDILRAFRIGGIDPCRFVFAEYVDDDHPFAGVPDWLRTMGGLG
jgi:hypothetical protein